MVGSGQLFPQLLSGVSHGSRPPRVGGWAFGLPDVAPHEDIPGAEKKRVTRQSFPSINSSFTEPLSKVSLRLPELGSGVAAALRPPPGAHRHAGLPPTPQPASEHAEDAQPTPRIRA